MFIKRDHRKIDEILRDPTKVESKLILYKRQSEFQGQLSVLCRSNYVESLLKIEVLNLYDNALHDVQGIEIFAESPLADLNLGCNKLHDLPMEFGQLKRLKKLWLEDNDLEQFPMSICSCTAIVSLRLSGNNLNSIPQAISYLVNLEDIALDNNEFEEFPRALLNLMNLKHMWLRQNKLSCLDESIGDMTSLLTLSLSSNRLVSIPDSLGSLYNLSKLYLNSNDLSELPDTIIELPCLEILNISNNRVVKYSSRWMDEFTSCVDGVSSQSKSGKKMTITSSGNPASVSGGKI
jgi:internalin A